VGAVGESRSIAEIRRKTSSCQTLLEGSRAHSAKEMMEFTGNKGRVSLMEKHKESARLKREEGRKVHPSRKKDRLAQALQEKNRTIVGGKK